MFEQINQKKVLLDAITTVPQYELDNLKIKLELDFIYYSNIVDVFVERPIYKLALGYIDELVKTKTRLNSTQIQQLYFIINNQKLEINIDKLNNLVTDYELNGVNLHPVEQVVYLYTMLMKVSRDSRLARLVVNLELMKKGYPMIIIKLDEQGIYMNIKKAVEESLDFYLTVI